MHGTLNPHVSRGSKLT